MKRFHDVFVDLRAVLLRARCHWTSTGRGDGNTSRTGNAVRSWITLSCSIADGERPILLRAVVVGSIPVLPKLPLLLLLASPPGESFDVLVRFLLLLGDPEDGAFRFRVAALLIFG